MTPDAASLETQPPVLPAVTLTHCPYCALQCGMTLAREDGRLVVRERNFPTNKGGLCRKGWTAADLLDHPDRLTTPLMRRDGALVPVGWDEALAFAASRIERIRDAYGPDSIGVFGGGGLTNETAYLLGKFTRVVLRSAHIDYNGRFCMASAAAAGMRALGIDRGLPFPLEDIAGAKTILLLGANPAETMPPIMQYFEAQRAAGGTLIVADPRRTATAKAADRHLALTPGSDGVLLHGLLHVAIRDHLIDEAFIAARTSGFEEARRIALRFWPDHVERLTGVPARDIIATAHALAAGPSMLLSARGAEQQSQGVANVHAAINLMLALGQIGKPRAGYGCLTGQGNGQGGREHGQKADQLPGYRRLADPAARAHIGRVWGVDPESLPAPGISAYELLDRLGPEGGIRALVVMGSNVIVSSPNAGHVAKRLAALDLLVVADIFLSETAAKADIVLPIAQWAEMEGTMTNLEGRVLLRRRAAEPPAGVRTDAWILSALAERLGTPGFAGAARETFEEFRRATEGGLADYAGVSWERIERDDGVFWPCPTSEGADTPRLFAERFATPDGRARFIAAEPRDAAELPDAAYPYFLTTGRLLSQYQSGTQTRRVASLVAADPEPCVELHPQMAKGAGIAQGEMVRVVSRRGASTFRVRFDATMRMDTIFVPFHWGGERSANVLTNPALDPVSRMPEFKVCAARIEKISP